MVRLFLFLLILALYAGKVSAQKRTTKTTKSVVKAKDLTPSVTVSKRKAISMGKQKTNGKQLTEPLMPIVLPVQKLPSQRLTSREIWSNPRQRHLAQASAERFVRFSGETDSTYYGEVWRPSKPTLLYRKNQSDSVWTVINLILPDYANHETRGKLDWERDGFRWIDIIKIDTLNLDHQGEPEVLISIFRDCCGNMVHTEYIAINLIDVNEAPKLLLTALIETSDNGGGSETSYVRRKVILKNDLLVGKIFTNRLEFGWERLLTPLKPGRYRYQGGHLVWVGR
jgi:hypothetical protein